MNRFTFENKFSTPKGSSGHVERWRYCRNSTYGIDFDSSLAFCSDYMSVWVFRGLFLWHAASQCWFEFRRELPNRLTQIPFQDVTQSFHTCRSPIWPGLSISSGVWIFACMNCLVMAWKALPNVSFAKIWNSSKKSNYFFCFPEEVPGEQ